MANDNEAIQSPQGEEKTLSPEDDSHNSVTPSQEESPNYVTGLELWGILSAVTLSSFLMMLDTSIIGTAVPRITSEFHSLDDIGWYGSAYSLASCALQPSAGKLYSQFNLKYTFMAFLAIFELGSALCGSAQSSTMLIIGRMVAGMGASGIMNGALTIIAVAAPKHKRPALLGIMMAISQLASLSGPLIGGALTQYASWRWCFYMNLPIGGFAALVLLKVKIPTRPNKTQATSTGTSPNLLSKLDLIGSCLFASFAVMLLLALQWGGTKYAWNNAIIIGLFCGAGITLIFFWGWQYRIGDQALMPVSILGKRIVWCSCLFVAFFFGGFLMSTFYMPIYFQAVKDVSPAMSGVYILPSILSSIFTLIPVGFMISKLGWYIPWSIASSILTMIAAGLMSTLASHTPAAKWIVYQIIAGIGRGCGMQIAVVAVQNSLPEQDVPIGTAIIVFSQTFGGSLFLSLGELVFSSSLHHGLKQHAPAVNATVVISAGATGIRHVVSAGDLAGVLQAYSLAIDHVFYLALGASAMTLIFCWGMGWRFDPKKKTITKA